jgi:hypothetical protein
MPAPASIYIDIILCSEKNVIGVTYVASRTGDLCKDDQGILNIPRITAIVITCEPGSDGIVVSVTESITVKCKYDIVMKHSAACGKFIPLTSPHLCAKTCGESAREGEGEEKGRRE